MKYSFFTIAFLFVFQLTSTAQLHDSTLIKKLSINGSCLCQTTLSNLQKSNANLKEVDVEEMDLSKGCFGQDSRFIAGKGYYSDKQPGMIFQKDQDSDVISKIRLTKEFKGNLPDGNYVDLSKFLLSDLFKLYPQFKDKWQSRDCSDYWRFSNDTISFYVKIDKSKKPQFPIDESYYMDKPVEAIDLIISCSAVRAYDEGYQSMAADSPVFFVDSVRIMKSDLAKINPDDVAIVSIIKDTLILKKFDLDKNDRVIYIETKEFAKQRYWKYFASKSPEYAKLVISPENDSSIQYILNAKVLKKNFEGDLALIDDKKFKGIQIISKEQLIKDYGIENKDYGVVISTNVSK
jgi:hypothetical protein